LWFKSLNARWIDMPPREYAVAPTRQKGDTHPLASDATIKIALARN
jgi:hypothetical protein